MQILRSNLNQPLQLSTQNLLMCPFQMEKVDMMRRHKHMMNSMTQLRETHHHQKKMKIVMMKLTKRSSSLFSIELKCIAPEVLLNYCIEKKFLKSFLATKISGCKGEAEECFMGHIKLSSETNFRSATA